MNLWHQKLLILGAKAVGVLIGLLFLGYLIYYNLYFKTDSLIRYVPKEAVVYATFRITPELGENEIINKISRQIASANSADLDFTAFNQLVGNNLSLALVPEANNSQLNILVLLDLGMGNDKADTFRQLAQNANWQSRLFANQFKSKNILAISDSTALLDEVASVNAKQKPALSQKIDAVLNLKKYAPQNFFGKIYIDGSFISEQAELIKPAQFKLLVKALDAENSQAIFGGIILQPNKLIMQNSNPSSGNSSLTADSNNWPPNVAYNFVVSNLADRWHEYKEISKQRNSQDFALISDKLEYLQGLYNFNWEQDILPLLSDKAQIISGPNNEYLIAATIKDGNLDSQTANIERLIKTYIANQYPITQTKQMPDNTYITQVVRDKNQYVFNEDMILGLKIQSIWVNNQEFIYIISENRLIIANSREIIINLLNSEQKISVWENSGILGNMANFSDYVYFNLSNSNIFINNPFFDKINLWRNYSSGNFMLILE
jgi:hypothetical protein